MKQLLKRLWKEDEGQDLIEYGLLITLIALAVTSAMKPLGQPSATFSTMRVAACRRPAPTEGLALRQPGSTAVLLRGFAGCD